eukprot:480972-Ditylum_brightwellii.AAC.2
MIVSYTRQRISPSKYISIAKVESNASSFISAKTMTGVNMYNTLLDTYQGLDHDKDIDVNALLFRKDSNLPITPNTHQQPS